MKKIILGLLVFSQMNIISASQDIEDFENIENFDTEYLREIIKNPAEELMTAVWADFQAGKLQAKQPNYNEFKNDLEALSKEHGTKKEQGFTFDSLRIALQDEYLFNSVQSHVGQKKVSRLCDTIKTEYGPALTTFAMKQCFNLAALALYVGADINQTTDWGETAFCIAIDNGHDQLINFLLQSGADVSIATTKSFYSTPAGQTALHRAVLYPDIKLMSMILLKNNKLVNIANEKGRTPLHELVYQMYGATEILETLFDRVNLLLEYGADINLVDKNGKKPVDIAVYTGVIQILHRAANKQEIKNQQCSIQ